MARWLILLPLVAVASCSRPAAEVEKQGLAEPQASAVAADAAAREASAGPATGASSPERPAPQAPVTAALLAYAYTYDLELPAARVKPIMARHQAACEAAGPLVCQVVGAQTALSGRDLASGRLELRARPDWLKRFRDGLGAEAQAAGGKLASSATETEDLSRSITDSEAQVRALTTLRDRLQRLLAERPGKLEEVLAVERELARVQGELDATQSGLAVMRTRVATSALTLTYRAEGVAAPDGVGSPLAEAFNGFIGTVLLVLAGLVTLASFLLPLALVAAPIAWWWLRRRKAKPRPIPRPPSP